MEKLPVVSEEVSRVISKELLSEPGNEYIAKILEELQKENPHIASFIVQFSKTAGDSIAIQTMLLYSGLLVYKMLKSQAEVDQLKQKFPSTFS